MTEEVKHHLCPVCQKEEWHPLDLIELICPKCHGQKMVQTTPGQSQTCDLCKGQGRVNFQLRDQRYWFDQNYLYDEPVGMKVCKPCGFVTYSPRWTEEQLQERYSKERAAVNASLIVRANVKNEFHKFFLNPELQPFKASGKVLDIGCSFGHIRHIFPEATIYGIEYASRFAKYAKDVNNITLIGKTQELLDKSVNLVMLYHTLEHVSDPRATLLEAKRVLADGGYLYVAVPNYFGPLREVSGMACLDFENLYHLNHNNVFSKTSLHNLLRQCGFEVIKQHDQYYGEAVLCRVNESVDKTIHSESFAAIENKLYHQRMAIDILSKCHKDQKADRAMMGIEAALSHYEGYVDGYEAMMVQKNNYKDIKAINQVWERGVKAGCETIHFRNRYALLLMNWCDAGQVNNYIRQAETLCLKSLEIMPGDTEALGTLTKIYAYNYKDAKKAEEYANKLLAINPVAWNEIQNVLGHVRCLE